MCQIECLFKGENGECTATVAGSQSLEYAAKYYCRSSVEKKMKMGVNPNCVGSKLKVKEETHQSNENVARS